MDSDGISGIVGAGLALGALALTFNFIQETTNQTNKKMKKSNNNLALDFGFAQPKRKGRRKTYDENIFGGLF